jgi:hypothetical protein
MRATTRINEMSWLTVLGLPRALEENSMKLAYVHPMVSGDVRVALTLMTWKTTEQFPRAPNASSTRGHF